MNLAENLRKKSLELANEGKNNVQKVIDWAKKVVESKEFEIKITNMCNSKDSLIEKRAYLICRLVMSKITFCGFRYALNDDVNYYSMPVEDIIYLVIDIIKYKLDEFGFNVFTYLHNDDTVIGFSWRFPKHNFKK